jgi:hypothetical protein
MACSPVWLYAAMSITVLVLQLCFWWAYVKARVRCAA